MEHISKICEKAGILEDEIEYFGKYKAKIDLKIFDRLETKSNGKLILVTAITPTKKGEGKSTVTIGLSQALNTLNQKSIACLREPSMGPVFGLKGGATGGGKSMIEPMEDINLHFTGDFHAITAATNLIVACIDNHIYWGNELNIDKNEIFVKRVIDTNDRALRNIEIRDTKYERETSFQITVASEIMAILCLSEDIFDLKKRISNIAIAKDTTGNLLRVRDLKIEGSIVAILKDAIKPNIVQTTENTPVLVHGGPFANIAHGCNSVIATKLALKLSEYTVTEAGFASDLGAEKFLDIKCRVSGLTPDLVVLVVTNRALKENGFDNLSAHLENLEKFNLNIVVAINKFESDTEEEIEEIINFVENLGYKASVVNSFAQGSMGALDLANKVIENTNERNFEFIYPINITTKEKIEILAKEIYRAENVKFSDVALEKLSYFKDFGIDNFPICVSKTPNSISDNPNIKGKPSNYTFQVNDIRPAFGAKFVVVMSGNIIDMPGLPKEPNALKIDIDDNGNIVGIF